MIGLYSLNSGFLSSTLVLREQLSPGDPCLRARLRIARSARPCQFWENEVASSVRDQEGWVKTIVGPGLKVGY